MFIPLKGAPNKPAVPVIDAGIRHVGRRIFRLRDLVSHIAAAICTGGGGAFPASLLNNQKRSSIQGASSQIKTVFALPGAKKVPSRWTCDLLSQGSR